MINLVFFFISLALLAWNIYLHLKLRKFKVPEVIILKGSKWYIAELETEVEITKVYEDNTVSYLGPSGWANIDRATFLKVATPIRKKLPLDPAKHSNEEFEQWLACKREIDAIT